VRVQRSGRYLLTLIVPNVGYARSGELAVDRDLEGVDLQLAPGALVTGQVRLRGLENLPGQLNVTLEEKQGAINLNRYSLHADGQGRFAFRDLPPGAYQMSASGGDFRPPPQTLTLAEGQAMTDLVLKVGPVVSGLLRALDGTLLANTQVQFHLVRLKPYTRHESRLVLTDGEGRYEVLVRDPGQYLLTAIVPNVGCARTEELTIATEDVEGVDLRLAPAASVAGRVRVRGTDDPPRRISLSFIERKDSFWFDPYPLRIDEQGRFTLQDLPAGTYQVQVSGVEYLPMPPQTLTLAAGQAVTDWVLELIPAPVVSGRLRAPDGTPLANREVAFRAITRKDNGYLSWGGQPTLDGNGGFSVRAPEAGPTQVLIRLAGVGYLGQDLEIREGEDLLNLEWRLKPFARVVGQVRRKHTGKPFAGAQVSLQPQGRIADFPGSSPQAASGVDGRFELKDLVAGEYQVNVSAEDCLPTPSQTLTLTEGQVVADFVLEVLPIPVISGRLLAPDGTPLAGWEVEFQAYTWKGENYRNWSENNRLTLDGNGGFTVRAVEVGPAQAFIRLEGVGYLRQALEVREGEGLTGLEWRLKPFAKVVGQVREKRTREPLAGIQVSLLPQHRGPAFPGLRPQKATSGGDGRIEFRGLVAGEYQVSASAEGYRSSSGQRVSVAEDAPPEELAVWLERSTRVAGRILGPDGETPLAGARVFIEPSTYGQDLERTTDAAGRFAFESVTYGNALRVEAEGFAVVNQPLRLEGADHPVEVSITLRYRGGTIAGQVRGMDTSPPSAPEETAKQGAGSEAAGGAVFALDSLSPQGGDAPSFLHEAAFGRWQMGPETDLHQGLQQQLKGVPLGWIDADGRYELTHVMEGEYTLYAVAPGKGLAQRENVAVREGQVAKVDLTLAPPQEQIRYYTSRITGCLTGPDGKPLANVNFRFRASGPAIQFGSGQTDAAGCYGVDLTQLSWISAQAGPYTLRVKVEGFRAAKRGPIELGNLTAENVDFQLESVPLGSLAGRVFLPDGETPAAGVWVIPLRRGSDGPGSGDSAMAILEGEEYTVGESQAVLTDAEGRYRIDRLEAGLYRAYALPRAPQSWAVRRPEQEVKDRAVPHDATAAAHYEQPPDPRLAETSPTLSDPVAVPENGVGEADVTLGRTGAIEGMVRGGEERQPRPDVSIRVHPSGDRRLPYESGWSEGEEVQTDAEGRFQISGLSAGTYRLSAHEPYRYAEAKVTVAPGATVPAELTLRKWKPAAVSGRVLRPDGRTPAPLAYVALHGPYGNVDMVARTDPEGRFELTTTNSGWLRVIARQVGYGRAASDWFNLTWDCEQRDVTLTLSEAGTISGQIKSGLDCEPEDVVIVAAGPGEPLTTLNPSLSWDGRTNVLCRWTRPDEEGRFTLTDVPAGRNALAVFVQGLPWLIQREVMVPGEEGTASRPFPPLTIPPPRGQISGTITTADRGTPLPEVYVTVFNEVIGWGPRQTQTDDQGRYILSGLPAGTYQVFANPPGRASQSSVEITVGGLAPRPRQTLRLRRGARGDKGREKVVVDFRLSAGGRVTGTALGPDGRPVAGAQVFTASLKNGWAVRIPTGLSGTSAITNEDGTYTLAPLSPGEYTLYASALGCAEARKKRVVVREGKTTPGVNWTLKGEE
jgi:hypothetical protein